MKSGEPIHGDAEYMTIDTNGKVLMPFHSYKQEIKPGIYIVYSSLHGDNWGWNVFDTCKNKYLFTRNYWEIGYSSLLDCFFAFDDSDTLQLDFNGNVIRRIVGYHYRIINGKYCRFVIYKEPYNSVGIQDLDGNVLVSGNYDEIHESLSGKHFYAVVQDREHAYGSQNNKYWIIDPKAKTRFELKYDYIREITAIRKGYPILTINRDTYDYSTKKILQPYDEKDTSMPHYLECKKDGHHYILNLDGEVVIDAGENYVTDVLNDNLDTLLGFKVYGHYDSDYDIYDFYSPDGKFIKTGRDVDMDMFAIRAGYGYAYQRLVDRDLIDDDYSYSAQRTITPRQTKPDSLLNDNSTTEKNLLFFDTETAGLPLDDNAPITDTGNWPRLVQISWILTTTSGEIVKKEDHIIKPNGYTIPKDASDIHGITTEIALNNGEPLASVIDLFIKDCDNAKIFVGHNVEFDISVVGCEMIRLGIADTITKKPFVCTMKSSTDFCKIPGKYGYKWPKLQELHVKLFGREFEDAHNSMSDIEATRDCYLELVKRKIINGQ